MRRRARLDAWGPPVEGFTLPNGLRVLVQPDARSPSVAVSVTYRVGSRDERPGRSGFAHLFEHLMAQGTRNLRPREISELVESNGGVRNAFTMKTNTTYYSLVPSGALEAVLWAEADRMQGLEVGPRALALEQQVVLEEMRRNYLNQPYRKAQSEAMARAAFSKWENRHDTIGALEDVLGAGLGDVRAFYREHYAPNNAVLVLAGDVSPARARLLARRYFGPVARRPAARRPDVSEPPLKAERRVVVADRLAKLPRLLVGWHAPPRDGRDFWDVAALMEALSGQEESPLYRRLARERRLAVSTAAIFPWWSGPSTMQGPDLFGFDLLLGPESDPAAAVAALDEFLSSLLKTGLEPSEIERAKVQMEYQWLHGLEFLLDRAVFLSCYAALVGPPARLKEDLAAIESVTPERVLDAARRWLTPGRAVVTVRPDAGAPEPAEVRGPEIPPEGPRRPGEKPPPIRALKAPRLPRIERLRLPGGLNALCVRDASLPLVELRLSLPAGHCAERGDEESFASAVSSLLLKGAGRRGADEIARSLASLGYSMETHAGAEHLLLSMSGLSRNFEPFLDLLALILREAAYPEPEADLWRAQTLQRLMQLRVQPEFMLSERLKAELYPGHPYGQRFPDEATLNRMRSEPLKAFHRRVLRPQGGLLVLVGDVSPERFARRWRAAFGGWDGGAGTSVEAPPRHGPALALMEREGSAQVNLCLAQFLPLTRKDPEYLAFSMANHILGGASTSRLFLNLRVDKGYTYGAYASAATRGKGTLWSASAETRAEVALASLREMLREIRRLRERPVPARELEGAKRHLAGLFALRLASMDRVADLLWGLEKEGLDSREELSAYLRRLKALKPSEIRRAASRHWDPARLVALAVGGKGALEALAPARGELGLA